MFWIVALTPAVVIFIITLVLAFVSKVLQRKLTDRKKMKELQKEIKETNKIVMKLIKEGDGKKKKEIDELQKKNLEKQMELMQQSNKLMLVSLPMFLVFFAALGFVYGGVILESPVPLPKFNAFFLLNPTTWVPIGLTTMTGYYKAYFFYYLGSSIIMWIIFTAFDKIMLKRNGENKN